MVTDFLAYARAGQGQKEPQVVDCHSACAQALANLRGEVIATGATIMVSPLPKVMGWFTHVQTLFQNLIQNAIKFRGENPIVVRIGWRALGKGAARLRIIGKFDYLFSETQSIFLAYLDSNLYPG